MVSKKFLTGIAALFCAASVQAGQIPLSTSTTLGSQLGTGQELNLQINVNNLLANAGYASNSIISGFLTVTGYSAPNYFVLQSNNSTVSSADFPYQSCNKNKCTTKTGTVHTHVNDITTNYFDLVADTMTVSAGDASESDSATDIENSYSDFSAQVWDKTNDNGNGTINKFYHRNRDHHMSLSGGLEVLLNLDATALADLAGDGILDLSISSFLGQFSVSDVRLDFVAEEVAVPPDSQVPVPTSLLLTGLGLAALATVRRRKA